MTDIPNPNLMLEQVRSLPDLLRTSFEPLQNSIHSVLDKELCRSIQRIIVTGCGDSHHAALSTELAIETLSGVADEPMTALQCARYAVPAIALVSEAGSDSSSPERGANLVIGISVSGSVARTSEALAMARKAGATTIALTAAPGSRVAEQGDRLIDTSSVEAAWGVSIPAGVVIPGVRSFFINQLALLLIGVHLGEMRGRLSGQGAADIRSQILSMADAVEEAIVLSNDAARRLAEELKDEGAESDGRKMLEMHILGGGPNYGTALFTAAKVLEASGDPVLAQDTEEWAHLQYFGRAKATPTFLITAGERDLSRMIEIAEAARTIGRRVIVVSNRHAGRLVEQAAHFLETPRVPEMFSALVTSIPGELFAAYRAETTGEPYFRGFGGGRSIEGGGGISRIRTSEVWEELPE